MKLETQLAGGVVLVDVSKELPRATRPNGKPIHRRRRVASINRCFLHHSGASGKPGLRGLINSTKHSLREEFHCCAYHVWVPEKPLYYLDGELSDFQGSPRDDADLAVLRANVDSERTWHTGGKANTKGWSICLQGNKNVTPLTWFQEECLEALLPWTRRRFQRLQSFWAIANDRDENEWIVPHSGAGPYGGKPKPACPGKYTEAWMEKKGLM